MPKYAECVTELIKNTPLLQLRRYCENMYINPNIYAKLEMFNPTGSIKDRAALAIIEAAERKGKLGGDIDLIIEATTGNMGVSLACICAIKGYKLVAVLPEDTANEFMRLLAGYGAQIVLTDSAKGMKGAISKAAALHKSYPNSYLPMQFSNSENPKAYKLGLAAEIWRDMEGKVDILVAGAGTGGAITGTAKALRRKNPNLQVVAVEPQSSPVLSGGSEQPHGIFGIGTGAVSSAMDMSIVDEIIPVSDGAAYGSVQAICATEGILAGMSSGAALYAASQIARLPENSDKNIVVIMSDGISRYLSKGAFEDCSSYITVN